MRLFPMTALLLLTSCSQSTADIYAGVYGSGPRDRLCLKKSGDTFRVGLIAYGDGNANCSFRGTGSYIEGTDAPLMSIHPEGDSACEFHVGLDAPLLTPMPSGPACDYYCGPGASLENKGFTKLVKSEPVTDFAGDPLC